MPARVEPGEGRGPLARLLFAPGSLPDWAAGQPPERLARAAFRLWLQSGLAALALYAAVAAAFAAWPEFRWPGLAHDARFLAEWTAPDLGWGGRAAICVEQWWGVILNWLPAGLPPLLFYRIPDFLRGHAFWTYVWLLCLCVFLLGLSPSCGLLRRSEAGFWSAVAILPPFFGFAIGLGESVRHPAALRPSRPCRLALIAAATVALPPAALAADLRLAGFGVAALLGGFALAYYRPPLALAYAGYHRWRPATFAANPYRADAAVRLPLSGVRRRLLALAPRQPEAARAFAAFLRARRPLQAGLAAELERAAGAGAR